MPVTIYHNPRCGKSRQTLALLQEKGIQPEIVEYLKTPYTTAQLKTLLGQLGLPAKAIVRKKEAAAAGVDAAKLSEDQLIAAMAKNPIIVERPIVVSGGKAALGRPPEAVVAGMTVRPHADRAGELKHVAARRWLLRDHARHQAKPVYLADHRVLRDPDAPTDLGGRHAFVPKKGQLLDALGRPGACVYHVPHRML
jgi:arsenate reductase